MSDSQHHLAQFNIGRLRRPRASPEMTGYNETLGRVLPVALGWSGFVWIMDDDIIAISERHYGPDVAANLSVWRDIASLEGFMSCPPHAAAIALRDDWFTAMAEPSFVLWWIAADHRPDFNEAADRLDRLRRHGPGPAAFTFEAPFAPPPAG